MTDERMLDWLWFAQERVPAPVVVCAPDMEVQVWRVLAADGDLGDIPVAVREMKPGYAYVASR